jgi:type I restriction enzyme M protein
LATNKTANSNNKPLASQQSVDQAVWSICDIMRRGNCASALQYVPELTWILFLRILDEREEREQQEAEALGVPFRSSLEASHRWRDWAAPEGPKRKQLENGALGAFFGFVNGYSDEHGQLVGLLPYLKDLKKRPHASPRQKVISEVISGVERVRLDTERNFLDVLDKVHQIRAESVDPTHVFTLSQVYEGLLLKLGEKNNDGGQFFTPRQIIKAMVRTIDPKIGETVYDPGCGTGGFLAQSFEYIQANLGQNATADQLETLKQRTFWGREKENLVYPIALANLVLHGIDKPNLWHGNTLTGREDYGGLFEGAPALFDVILTNPPFGGKEGKEAQTNFDYKTSATQRSSSSTSSATSGPAAVAASCSMRDCFSAPTKRPSSKPSASCSTTATSGASSACPPACSPRPARGSRPTYSFSPRASPRARSGTTT